MTYTKETLKEAIIQKLRLNYGCTEKQATDGEMMKACAMVLRDIMAERGVQTREETFHEGRRKVHYLSMEFLMGRSLMKNAYNLELLDPLTDAIDELGFKAADIFEIEPDAGLGNGGLGRLAACYLDSMTTLDIPAAGYSICYELGIFKQKIVEGQQVELPDDWMQLGDAWLLPKLQEAEEVHFGGKVRSRWDNGHLMVVHEDYTRVLAVPCDMEIAGYDTDHVNTLRLWQARSPKPIDMKLFSQGQYLQASEERAMADAISQVLYPEDNHYEGKSLRLKQQYFFVSATMQSITRKHIEVYGTLKNFHEKNVIQINDTHPTLMIPELMRLFMDEDGLGWDEAWDIVTACVNYTNHTVMSEALETWPQGLIQSQMPRVWEIICEINRRWCEYLRGRFGDDARVGRNLILADGKVHMANLCLAACKTVNGVSGLHGDILKNDLFRDVCALSPERFTYVTNGIDHRRWLAQINPGLHRLVCDLLGGDGYLLHPEELCKLNDFTSDPAVLAHVEAIKRENKLRFAQYTAREGFTLDTDAILDVQVKRLHEYKRQLLCAMLITALQQRLHDDPNQDFVPRTFVFGAKAAPGYATAKRIIQLLCSLAADVNADPVCKGRLQVHFLENYRVSVAEVLMPAVQVSEQISTAGKEASGTGNMKMMMNGAVTIGTLDGANVEMYERLGDRNMFLFGLHADEADALRARGYNPLDCVRNNDTLRRVLERMNRGYADGESYSDLAGQLLYGGDPYLLLADFKSYVNCHDRLYATISDPAERARLSLVNTAESGVFAADRAVLEYAQRIWRVK